MTTGSTIGFPILVLSLDAVAGVYLNRVPKVAMQNDVLEVHPNDFDLGHWEKQRLEDGACRINHDRA